MYVWLDQESVIEIKATDYTVFINSKDEDEMNAWYQALSNEQSVRRSVGEIRTCSGRFFML